PARPAADTAPTPMGASFSPPLVLGEGLGVGAAPQTQEIVWDEADLLEFAQGKIANVFGPEYGIIDSYSRRVRLPTPPYLLVSRVTKLSATRGRFEPCSLTTEYDIPHDAWYLADGQTPWAVAVESGQCDLLLISYLGIDFECKGERVYRLLDATLTFLDQIPMGGDTLRYDISINSYARSGPSLLFFFSYNCYIGEKLVLTMRNGCAGFFTDQELAEGQGVIFSDSELEAFRKVQAQHFEPLLKSSKSSFTYADLLLGSEGKMAECFGPDYDQAGLNPSLRLPPPMMLMADRILSIDPHGGRWGLGLVIAEKDLLPEDWYFPCHFMDDQVLAGSLMSDGCVQLMQFYMLYLGFQTETKDARFHPLNNLPQSVRCRGQVTPINRKMTYKLEITEIGLTPEPYAKANVSIMVDGKFAVYFEDLGLRLVEKDASDPFKIDPFDPSTSSGHRKLRDRAGSSSGSGGSSSSTPPKEVGRKKALFDEADIEAFATGSIVDCFGEEYAIYTDRRASRTPNGPLKLVSRIVEMNAQRHDIKPLSSLVSEYDVPADAWFYQENNAPTMPYSILLEIALQPCGFLSAYLGSTLPYPEIDFYFRNLDGQATLSKVVDLRGKTITNRVRLLSSTAIQGIVIQKFDYELLADGELFYKGDAAFGYFTKEALSDQVGLDSGKFVPPWYQAPEANIDSAIKIDLRSTEGQALYRAPSGKAHYRLAQERLNLLDEVLIVPNGGRHEEGYVYGAKAVDPNDWFFTAHFYQDPVMPGSLGIEAILQAMQTYALQAGLGAEFDSPYFELLADHHMIWKYRGQIPHIKIEMQVDVHLTRIEKSAQQITLYGDASLWRDKLRVYEIKNIALNILESPK
ncbi:MAG: 3-hydroxyacyl-[acyl-carrier-protein] dehydratase FabA, partial [Ardenticatenaceae bacterium]